MQATSQTESGPVAELIHFVVAAGVVELDIIWIFESEYKVVACSIELSAENPFFGAKSTKFISTFVLHDQQSDITSL